MVGQVGRMETARQQKIDGKMLEQRLLTAHQLKKISQVKSRFPLDGYLHNLYKILGNY